MSLYLDTSVLLKLIFLEPETQAALDVIEQEAEVIVSSLTRLEAITAIYARKQSGLIRPANARKRIAMLDKLLATTPFMLQQCSSDIFAIAEHHLNAAYSPTLDGLHLAVMKSLKIQRLLTNDSLQAKAATLLGFTVHSLS